MSTHRVAIAMLALLAAGAAAAQNPRPLGRIAVLPSADLPMIVLDHLPANGETAGESINAALANCSSGSVGGGSKDIIAALLACPTVALGVGAVAAVKNDPQKIGSATTAVQSVFAAERSLQARFGEEVARRAAQQLGERFVAQREGADSVLEAGIIEIRTLKGTGGTIDPQLHLVMSASVRIVDARSGEVLSERLAVYSGQHWRRSRWTQDGSKLLREDVERGADELAAYVMDVGLLLYDFPAREAHPARNDRAATIFGIEPEAPAAGRKWTRVESIQPELRWEAFPRPADQAAAPEDMARVRDVTYDIVIAEAAGAHVGPVVYRRERIAQTAHRVESPLLPRHLYYWSVRARFTLDGNEHATDWARMRLPTDFVEVVTGGAIVQPRPAMVHAGSFTAPYSGSYRFSTP